MFTVTLQQNKSKRTQDPNKIKPEKIIVKCKRKGSRSLAYDIGCETTKSRSFCTARGTSDRKFFPHDVAYNINYMRKPKYITNQS